MKKIHLPSFSKELQAAGLAGCASISAEGAVSFPEGVNDELKAAFQIVYDAHDGDAAEASIAAVDAWERIKAKRDAIKAGGVKVGTKWYHTDTESRIQHLGLLEKARTARAAGGTDATRLQALGQDIKWKTMDGSFIYLTVKHAEDIFAAVTDLDAAAFAAAETHRVAMEASADPAAYDFSVGWPATFAG